MSGFTMLSNVLAFTACRIRRTRFALFKQCRVLKRLKRETVRRSRKCPKYSSRTSLDAFDHRSKRNANALYAVELKTVECLRSEDEGECDACERAMRSGWVYLLRPLKIYPEELIETLEDGFCHTILEFQA